MSDEANTQENSQEAAQTSPFAAAQPPKAPEPPPVEIDQAARKQMLMARARTLGITFSNNITADKLSEKINAHLDGAPQAPEEPDEAVVNPLDAVGAPEESPEVPEAPPAPKKTLRQQQYEEQMKLVRLRVTCMNPQKKDLQGEIFTIANEYIGTVRKFVPFGEATEEGFHVPYCIYTMMRDRTFLNIRTVKDRRTGTNRVEPNYAREFALEVLDPLTPAELARLATAQAAAGSIDPGDSSLQ